MKESKLYKEIKVLLKAYFSRYSYVLWVSFTVSAFGSSFFSTLLILLVLAVLIAWRDRQFIEDGHEIFITSEQEISNKLKSIFNKFKSIFNK